MLAIDASPIFTPFFLTTVKHSTLAVSYRTEILGHRYHVQAPSQEVDLGQDMGHCWGWYFD